MQRQAGFTLIELVMVIVILGILSAFALPRFADLGQEARTATIQAALGAVKAASAIAHADSLVNNNPATVTLDGLAINMVNGYPQALAAGGDGILDAAQITTGAAGDFDVVTANAGAAGGAEIIIQAKGAAAAANCQVSYTAALPNAAPIITVDATDC